MDFIIIDENPEDDVLIRDEPVFNKPEEFAKTEEEDYPYTIIAVTIGDNGNVEETDDSAFSLETQRLAPNHEQESTQENDSSETDNSEDWNDFSESLEPSAKRAPNKFSKTIRKGDSHPCPYCEKEFERKYNLENHIRIHTGEKPFGCSICKTRFSSKTGLNTHKKKRHSHVKSPMWKNADSDAEDYADEFDSDCSFSCSVCEKTFKSKTVLRRHMKSHPTFLNSQISETSITKPDAHKSSIEANLRCSCCDKAFSSSRSLKIHESRRARNMREKPYSCDQCGVRTRDKAWMSRHILSHSRARPHGCSFCKKRFITKDALRSHLNCHTQERPYSCSVCEKTFKHRGNLYMHKKKHGHGHGSGMSVSCSLCYESFDNDTALRLHLVTHKHPPKSSAPVVSCPICHKRFKEYNLPLHMPIHTKESIYSVMDPLEVTPIPEEITEIKPAQNETPKPLIKRECPICHKAVCNVSRHMLTHNGGDPALSDKPFGCKDCGAKFWKSSSLAYHLRTHNVKRPFRCAICKRGFNSKHTYEVHFKKKCAVPEFKNDGSNAFSCRDCGARFSKSISLSYHMRTHKVKRAFRCAVCLRGFDAKHKYDRHFRTHFNKPVGVPTDPSKPLKCPECGLEFSRSLSLQYHIRTHKVKRAFRCAICKRGFDTKERYDGHFRRNCIKLTEDQPERINGADTQPEEPDSQERLGETSTLEPETQTTFSCSFCPRQLPTKILLRSHLYHHKTKDLKKFVCKECGLRFHDEEWLVRHMEIHDSARPFHCEICNKRFSQQFAYDSHKRIHTDERPYPCTVCNHSFKHRSNLRFHMRTHTGEKPFSCPICFQGFTRNSSVRRHVEGHKGYNRGPLEGTTQPFICSICGFGFNTKLNLLYHKRSHKIRRPLRCMVCKAKHYSMQELNNHMRMHSCVVKLMRMEEPLDHSDLSTQESPVESVAKHLDADLE